jgi:flagellar biosynthetic protein FlhB
MAGPDDSAERSHAPTARRLEQARREGQILTSKEMMIFATMAAGILALALLAMWAPRAAARWAADLRLPSGDAADAALLPAVAAAGWQVVTVTLIIAGPVMVAAIAAQAATGGIGWTAKNVAPKPKKLNPLSGLKRMVSANALVELGKAVAKVLLLSAVGLAVVMDALPQLLVLGGMPTGDALGVISALLLRFLVALTLVLGLIGAVDLFWQARKHSKQLFMTLAEVKRENREDNGSPELKGKLRRLQMEASQRGARERAALPQVDGASVLVTNPQHFAVAMRYSPGRDDAPVLVAAGRDMLAARMRQRARDARVPVLEAPSLARALYFTGQIGSSIDPRLYTAVAAVLAHVWRLERGEAGDLPGIDLPPEMRFDANGRPEQG